MDAEFADLDVLPALPEPIREEMDDLARESEKPSKPENTWNLPFPPFPVYDDYIGQVWYSDRGRDGQLFDTVHPETTRERVRCTLAHLYCLRKHLNANLALLQQYGEADLAAPIPPTDRKADSLTPLEVAQNSFAIHHIGIHETLSSVSIGLSLQLGLPDREPFRQSRNFFAHDFGTPNVMLHPYQNLSTEVRGKTALYDPLLIQVETNIKLLDEQLANKDNWRKPDPPKRTDPVPEPTEPVSEPYGGADAMAYEPQTQDWPYEEDVQGKQRVSCCVRSFRYLFFRSGFVRKVSRYVEDCLVNASVEYDNENVDFSSDEENGLDESYAPQENEDGSSGSGPGEEEAATYAW